MHAIASRSFLVGAITALSLPLWAAGGAVPAPVPAAAKREAVSVHLPGAAFAAMQTIDPEHIRWHVRYLSHDLLEGRGTGQRGEKARN